MAEPSAMPQLEFTPTPARLNGQVRAAAQCHSCSDRARRTAASGHARMPPRQSPCVLMATVEEWEQGR